MCQGVGITGGKGRKQLKFEDKYLKLLRILLIVSEIQPYRINKPVKNIFKAHGDRTHRWEHPFPYATPLEIVHRRFCATENLDIYPATKTDGIPHKCTLYSQCDTNSVS